VVWPDTRPLTASLPHGALARPQKKYRVPGTPRDETMENWWIHGLSINAAQGVVAASSDNAQLKKDMLKVHGAGWVAAAALDAYHAYGIKTQNQAVSDMKPLLEPA
jgi:hypothetical protein